MTNMLEHLVNKIVRVSVPFLFKDSGPCPCRLVAVETCGLWLAGAELAEKLFPDAEKQIEPVVFIPFTQIAYLIEAPPTPPDAGHLHQEHHEDDRQKMRTESSSKKRR
jgi:hypothetical protein